MAPSSLQNLPAHRDLTSDEAKKRANSLQSLLAFAAEVQARQQTDAPSTGASSCHEDEPQREPPVTPPAPAKVPPLAMAFQQQIMSFKEQSGSEEKSEMANKASPPTPVNVTPRTQACQQPQDTSIGGNKFQAPSVSGSEVETPPAPLAQPGPPAVELIAEPTGLTRVSSASSLGNVQISCVISTNNVNVGRQVYTSPPAGPARANSATSPRVRVRPPDSEIRKADATLARNLTTHVRTKSSPLWPQAGHDPLQRTAKFGQPLGTPQRFTQANVTTMASSHVSMAPAGSLPRVHSPPAGYPASQGRGSSFGQMISRTDYTTSPRSPTAIPQA